MGVEMCCVLNICPSSKRCRLGEGLFLFELVFHFSEDAILVKPTPFLSFKKNMFTITQKRAIVKLLLFKKD